MTTPDVGPAAVVHVRDRARARSGADRRRIATTLAHVAGASDRSPESLAGALFRHPVTINFHPDRIVRTGAGAGLTTAESLLHSGGYLTQYQTGISAGGLTAHPGGDRHRWEIALFGAGYAAISGSAPDLRPRYGGLNLAGYADGACPRFGSCVLVLRPEVMRRCTFSVGDSYVTPDDTGTADAPLGLLAGLLEVAARTGRVLNLPDGTVAGLIDEVMAFRQDPTPEATGGVPAGDGEPAPGRRLGRALDDYVEAQIHGPVDLTTDVAGLIVDPSFDDTADGRLLAQIGDRFGFPLLRHPGFALDADQVGPDFRGPAIPAVAQRVQRDAGNGVLTAAAIGRAAVSVVRDPIQWADHADPATTAQHLKQLWHTLVAFGREFRPE